MAPKVLLDNVADLPAVRKSGDAFRYDVRISRGKIVVEITVSDVFSTIDFHHCQFFRSSPFFQDIKTTVFELESGDQLINALVV